MTTSAAQTGAFTVLFVCTGNICRSALAEHLGRAYLEVELDDRAAGISLRSAGTRAVVGSGMHPDTALVLTGLGGDPHGHVARQLTPRMVLDADLVLTMTRSHRNTVLKATPRAMTRTFTLQEAAALVGSLDSNVPLLEADLLERRTSLVRALAAARSHRASTAADDIADPIGRPLVAQQKAGDEVAGALLVVLQELVQLPCESAPGLR